MKIFITGESGTIPMAIQKIAENKKEYEIINNQLKENLLTPLKKHQSFKVRKPEIDFLDRNLLFSEKMYEEAWKDTDVIIHSGAFVGTDFCQSNPNLAIQTNVIGTQNIVDVCNKFGIKLVYLSTTAIFDPNDYSEQKPIREHTKINPQTIYGITKYAGELIVKNTFNGPHLILRPVFGFGNYPDDLHSALTKVIYTLYRNQIKKEDINLKVLLNKKIKKSYTRVENIANSILKIISYSDDKTLWCKQYNIGENVGQALDWHDLFDIIFSLDNDLTFKPNNIKFFEDEDYLHWHNIDDMQLMVHDLDFKKLGEDYIDIKNGIQKTMDSVKNNIDEVPYWI